jgi:sialate O-acetylesterase
MDIHGGIVVSAKLTTLAAIFAVAAGSAFADVNMPTVFGNNMVLQRDRAIPVWGWADVGESVTVEFAGKSATSKAKGDGSWRVDLPAQKANAEAQTLTVKGKNTIAITNVLVGDVWVCSGQSNMEWSVAASAQPKEEAAVANYPLIRHIKVKKVPADQPKTHFEGQWQVCAPNTVMAFTAVGYYFGRRLHKELNVPIGLLNTSWGGTRIEPWTPPAGFNQIKDQSFAVDILKRIEQADPKSAAGKVRYEKAVKDVEAWLADAKTKLAAGKTPGPMPTLPTIGRSHQDPTRLYNGMVAPLIPYAIRGAIWYQGESNGGEAMTYYHKKHALVKGWREIWGQGDFPFYWVQLANFRGDNKLPQGGDGYAKIREAERLAMDLPKTGMATIIDIGDTKDIHPKNKQDVGGRLAQWALAQEYGKDIVPSGPLFKEAKVEGDKIRISFDNVGGGLIVGEKKGLAPTTEVAGGKLQRFAISADEKIWVWADAVIDGVTVVVSSPKVPKPIAVRYAYSGNPLGANLYNKEGLPASPFKTGEAW